MQNKKTTKIIGKDFSYYESQEKTASYDPPQLTLVYFLSLVPLW